MEHLDRLKTYKEVRDKVVSLCSTVEDTDIGGVDESSPRKTSGRDGGWTTTTVGTNRS